MAMLVAFEIIADIFAKEYSLSGKWTMWVAGITGYIIANSFWLNSIRNGAGLARGATIFATSSAVVACAIGVVFYKEEVSKATSMGLLLGIISIYLLMRE